MKVEITEDERYPYIFVSTRRELLEAYWSWPDDHPYKASAIREETDRFRRAAFDVPDAIVNALFDARRREEAALEELKRWMVKNHPDEAHRFMGWHG